MDIDIADVLASLQRQIGEYARQVAMLEATIAAMNEPVSDTTTEPNSDSNG